MLSGIRIFACSGILGGLPSNRPEPPSPAYEINNIVPALAQTAGQPNRLGFFGSNGAPSSPIIVGQYQDTTFRTDSIGANLNQFINVKFITSSTATISGTVPGLAPQPGATIQSIPNTSGTIFCRFREENDSLVTTRNGTFHAVVLTSNFLNGVNSDVSLSTTPDNVVVKAAQLRDTDGFAGDTAWTEIADGGGGVNAGLSIEDQDAEATVHDYHLIISCSPQAAGQKINWGFILTLEFL